MISPVKRVAAATMLTVLCSCVSPQTPGEQISADVSAMAASPATIVMLPVVSSFDQMRAALPAFELRRSNARDASYGEISVVRDIDFLVDKDVLSEQEVLRLESLKIYLRTHPKVLVRIDGYGDGGLDEREAELSLARAQAVSRALLSDVMVSNTIHCVGAGRPHSRRRNGSVEIIFIEPTA